MGKIKDSPLIEAIFELRWGEDDKGNFEYKQEEINFFPGIFSQSIKTKGFEYSELLNQVAGAPALPYQPKYRFRKARNKWPCYQIGLGLFTANQIGNASVQANENDEYDWDDFKPVIIQGIETLNATYPDELTGTKNLKAFLRYQDGFYLEGSESFESFVSNKIQADIKVSHVFTDQPHITKNAKEMRLAVAYETSKPVGEIAVTVSSAQINGKRGVIIETNVVSPIDLSDRNVKFLTKWCEEAHDLQQHSFKTLITEGEAK